MMGVTFRTRRLHGKRNTVRSYHPLPPAAALVLVLLSGARAWAADPMAARAGAARIPVVKPQPTGPTPMVRRGLILPPGLLDVYMQPAIERPIGANTVRLVPAVGALWGVGPEVHADFQITPFFLPQYTAGPARIGVTRRIVNTRPLDVGVNLTTLLDPTAPSFVGFIQPGMAAILRTNGHVRIDSGLQLPLYTATDPHFGVRVPVAVYFQITDRIHCGSTSAFFVSDLRRPHETASIPLGFTAGYSAGPELDFAAFTPYVVWTNFYVPGTGIVDTRSFIAGIIADVAFELP